MKRRPLRFFSALFLLAAGAAGAVALAQQPPAAATADVWAPFRVFVGTWKGSGQGSPGAGTGQQTWAFILRGTFLQVRNITTVAPSDKNPKGEVHEDMGVFSYDKNRQKFILRQFHVEGFVTQYVLAALPAEGQPFVFVTESIENIPAGFKARITYRFADRDSFEQTFDLAAPGQDFICYSKGLLKRTKGTPR